MQTRDDFDDDLEETLDKYYYEINSTFGVLRGVSEDDRDDDYDAEYKWEMDFYEDNDEVLLSSCFIYSDTLKTQEELEKIVEKIIEMEEMWLFDCTLDEYDEEENGITVHYNDDDGLVIDGCGCDYESNIIYKGKDYFTASWKEELNGRTLKDCRIDEEKGKKYEETFNELYEEKHPDERDDDKISRFGFGFGKW